MVFGLFGRKKSNRRIVDDVYMALTEAARQPVFYEQMSVPDTVMGRFEMVAAHMVVLVRRLSGASPAGHAFAQDLVDTFFQDIDHSIREIGIGDMGVPKRMKKLARMFYGRYEAYDAALAAGDDEALAMALTRNVHPGAGDAPGVSEGMAGLASHLHAAARNVAAQPEAAILSGRVEFPAPQHRTASEAS
ncbi:ubiquinol-cytochrome C chaperone family protein [Pararhizobium haloflavum]|uniref:ubiquinol-cytochrome C chaperone family protein n=1 Tax=Pararhizobium haloflavum TaxID=2037914 RepID=UPI000C188063|nr:ubiquinol-cytochrome C chaperone family protein [Pararhizobium haloflavum]